MAEATPDLEDPGPGRAFAGLVRRDLLLAFRRRSETANPPLFFLMVTALVPLGVSPEPDRLAALAPGVIWIMALLATLLALDGLFQADYRDGSLEQMVLSPQPLWLMVIAKVLIHWLTAGLPLVLLSPLLALMLGLPAAGYLALVVGLGIGTAVLSLVGALGAALTVSVQRGGMLTSLIVLPLYCPVLVFGAGTVERAIDGGGSGGLVAVLCGLLAFALLVFPFAAAGALKAGLSG